MVKRRSNVSKCLAVLFIFPVAENGNITMEIMSTVHVFVKSLLFVLLCSICEGRESELSYVTCGSLVKLLNTRHNVRLHSHDVKYGSGNTHFCPHTWRS